MATTAAPSIESVPIFSNGKWSDLKSKRAGDVYNPSTGQVDRRVRFVCDGRANGGSGRGRGGRAAGVERDAGRRAGPVDVPLSCAAGAAFRRVGGAGHARAWQDAGRSAGRGESRDRGRRVRLRHSEPDDGRHAAEHCDGCRCRGDSPPGRRVRGHHAVQLSVHGAAVDVPDRDRPAATRLC